MLLPQKPVLHADMAGAAITYVDAATPFYDSTGYQGRSGKTRENVTRHDIFGYMPVKRDPVPIFPFPLYFDCQKMPPSKAHIRRVQVGERVDQGGWYAFIFQLKAWIARVNARKRVVPKERSCEIKGVKFSYSGKGNLQFNHRAKGLNASLILVRPTITGFLSPQHLHRPGAAGSTRNSRAARRAAPAASTNGAA